MVGLVTVTCRTLFFGRDPDVVMAYLFGVGVISAGFGYAAAVLTAFLSVAAFDFFFTLPYDSLRDVDERYLSTYAMMLVVALFISHRTHIIRKQTRAAQDSELAARELYVLSEKLSTARSAAEVVATARAHIRRVFGAEAVVLLVGPEGLGQVATGSGPEIDAAVRHRASEVLGGADIQPGRLAERTAEYVLPLGVTSRTFGVLVVLPPPSAVARGDPTAVKLLEAFAVPLALALDRIRSREEVDLAHAEVLAQERLRNALLSSVSHDLRGPLSVVQGAATALVDGGDALSPARRREYLRTISDQASGLNRLLGNLINMTSLDAGMVTARKEYVPTEEVIGAALSALEESLHDRSVKVRIEPEATMVWIDPVLFQQVLVNLLENAAKYSSADLPIEISAHGANAHVELHVEDRGPGVPAGEEERVFEKFHRATASAEGMGLGLTICRGIVTVHGGTIRCENRPGGGARFVVTLPDGGPPCRDHGDIDAWAGIRNTTRLGAGE
jgi:two-component system sensor histidine kinase KdpD